MDPRSSYFHQTRYAQRPLPPPPHPFPNNPNFHHPNLLPPPPPLRPPPPPAPPQSHHPIPTPPPPFNLQNSQFTHNSNANQPPIHHHVTYRPRSHPDPPNFSQLPRILHRPTPFEDDVSRRLPDFDHYVRDNRRPPTTPRVLPDNWPVSPIPKIRHELNTNSRFIEEHKPREELVLVGRVDENYHHQHHRRSLQFGSNSDRSSREFRIVSNQSNDSSISRGFESNSGSYENRRGGFEYDHDAGVSERSRWVHDREVVRDALIEMGSNETGDGIRIVTGKREHYRSREMNVEFERHSSGGSREGSHEFNRTPRKQIQKKSALLRIQKPNYRNREDERMHYSVYFNDTKPSFFRGKDQDLYSDRRMEEEVREGSPVELDVSFKSNSLVAKAIVTPPSGSTAISDTNWTPGNSKVRKVLVSDKETSSSPMTRPNVATKKLEKSVCVVNNASSSDKDLKQPKEKVTASGTGNLCDSSSLSGSSGTNVSLEKSRVEKSTEGTVSDKGGTNFVSGKTSSLKVVKKKKIVKKLVKKVVNPNLNSSQPTKTSDDPVKADGLVHDPVTSSDPDKAAAVACIVDSQPCPNEVMVIPNNDKVEGFAKTMASEKVGTGAGSGMFCVSDIRRKRSCSTSPMGSPSHEETKFDDSLVNVSSVNNLHAISNTDKDFSKSLNETISSEIGSVEDVSKQFCQNGDSFLLKNNVVGGSPEVLLSVEGNADLGSLSSEKIICHEGDIGTLNVGCKQPCTSQESPPVENGVVDGLPSAIVPVVTSELFCLSNSGKTRIQDVATCADCSTHGVGMTLGSDNGCSNSEEINFSSLGTGNDIGKQSSPDGVTILTENVLMGRSLNTMGSIVGSEDDAFDVEKNGKEVDMPWLDVARSEVIDMCLEPVNKVSSARWVDTTLRLSFKDPSPAEFTVSGNDCVDVGLQPYTNAVSAFQQSSLTDVSEAKVSVSRSVDVDPNGASPGSRKKRKFSDSQLELCDPITSDSNEGPVIVGISTSGGDVPSNSGNGLTQAGEEVALSCMFAPRGDVPSNFCNGLTQPEEEVTLKPNGASPGNRKRRKFSDSQLELCGPVTSDTNEASVIAGISTSGGNVLSNPGNGLTQPEEEVTVSCMDPLCGDVRSNSCNGLAQPEEEVAVSCMDSLCTSDLPLLQKGITAFLENCSAGDHFNSDASEDDVLTSVHSRPIIEDLTISRAQSPCPSELGDEQIVNATPVMAGSGCQNDFMDIDTGEGQKMDDDAAKDQVVIDSGTAQCQIPSELHSPDLDERLPCTNVESDIPHGVKNDLLSMSNNLSSFGDDNGVSTINFSDELVEFAPDTLANVDSPETLPTIMGTSNSQISIEKVSADGDKIPVEEPAIQGGSNLSAHTSHSQNAKIVLSSDHSVEGDHSLTRKIGSLPLQDSKNTTQPLNLTNGESYGRKNQPSPAVSRIYPGRSSFVFTGPKSTASSTHITKPRTWLRTDNSSALASSGNRALSSIVSTQRQLPKKVAKIQSTSYIRKGNSLVRKPILVTGRSEGSHGLGSIYQPNRSATDEVKKNVGFDSRIDVVDAPNFVRTGGMPTSFERPGTPPLHILPQMPNHATNSLGDCISSPLAEPLHNGPTETASDSVKLTDSNDVPKSYEDMLTILETPIIQTSQINNLECESELKDGNLVSSNVKSITYVKRKSNQLIATSNPCVSSVHNAHITSSSDGYYKRRKNQLIRTSLESQVKQTVGMLDGSLNTEGQTALNVISGRGFSKKRLRKVVTKTCKPSKFSLVWTLCGAQLSNNDGDSLHGQKVLPHLFPWKRATYWRSVMPNSASNSNNSSLSTIRKLLVLRKRDTIYTRSKHGFSLRKSKVLSVGGSSLKWSKSIERHSKKANEEATLAVAAAERKKREQGGTAHIVSRTKSRNSSSRERIFRIGSVRYKMDSSGRTLQRISDDESSCSEVQTEKDAKKPYVPRRLVIGKDEYVRIGNGYQLIRDPKKRTRILASEKVRWSLHTARSRLARRRKYCQFFTRFGKCNKDDGKCPYIHDSSKIAVCTKFLNGLCSNPDCKLTHKVIPERMPDCSYFLQGLCTNKSCPYRHVHVNPNASTCEGFLRGYCADGNECRKKHSYVCPIYEATGSCPQGSKCKLHHPKNRSKEKKSKRSREKKNAQGRYFGPMHIIVSEPRNAMSEKHFALDNDDIIFEGSIADYISLDGSDEEAVENKNPTDEQTTFSDSDPLDLQFGDPDELIKPIRIMNI